MYALLPQEFYARDALHVARELIGRWLVHGPVTLRITETEAYRWPMDTANHCRAGRTARNAPMWGPPGHGYVYLCYGIHQMLNIVTNVEGEGAAVLIRAAEPVQGTEVVIQRRGGRTGSQLLAGPGRVGQALAVDGRFSRHAVYEEGGLEIRSAPASTSLLAGPRVGIGYADPRDIEAPWRFADADSPYVSHRRTLYPCGKTG